MYESVFMGKCLTDYLRVPCVFVGVVEMGHKKRGNDKSNDIDIVLGRWCSGCKV